jgi:hypothetical protein
LAGFPGKLGMDGAQVWATYQSGQLGAIRSYCETDVVNTYLAWCRFQKMRGLFEEPAYDAELRVVRESLQALEGAHWRAFLQAWPAA